MALNFQKKKENYSNASPDWQALSARPLSDVLRNVCLYTYIYIETFNQVGHSKSALFMQLSISGIPPECAAFARPTALQCY